MKKGRQYWNPILETLPREKFQKLQFNKFQNMFYGCEKNIDLILCRRFKGGGMSWRRRNATFLFRQVEFQAL